ncbi:hypothetical protein LCGC14_2512310 [marine sediment metagenome]|uniref:Uncharacterized protein n=1 Tax=marine sediment metagenome TaxID=412755 RepID=A0A0F9BLQ1_9ZZZZ
MRKKKSQAQLQVWLFALLFLFMISLVYIIMTKPYIAIRDKFASNFTGTEFEPTMNKINTYWILWPVILIGSIMIWAFMTTMGTTPPRLP